MEGSCKAHCGFCSSQRNNRAADKVGSRSGGQVSVRCEQSLRTQAPSCGNTQERRDSHVQNMQRPCGCSGRLQISLSTPEGRAGSGIGARRLCAWSQSWPRGSAAKASGAPLRKTQVASPKAVEPIGSRGRQCRRRICMETELHLDTRTVRQCRGRTRGPSAARTSAEVNRTRSQSTFP